jgi:uncharacterized protein with HEPN domain
MPLDSDFVRVRHMLDAAREAMQFCEGRTRSSLDTDRMLARALVRTIEMIGEAASQVSKATREELASVPWSDMASMRERLIHTYVDIDLDIVWNTAEVDLPPLVKALREWLSRR